MPHAHEPDRSQPVCGCFIGGFDLALQRAGARVVAAVEIDQACRGVLARHFPETHLFSDVTEVTGDQLRAAGFVPGRGILAGGWPCQDLSIAGLRAGLGGARSGLFWHIVRLARELRPRWLVLENVDDLLSSSCPCPGDNSCVRNRRSVRCGKLTGGKWHPNVQHNPPAGVCAGGCVAVHGGAMGAVVGALEQLGYGLCWRVLDAEYFGVPQRRNRLFFAGCLGDGAAPAEVLLEPEGGERDPAAGRTEGPDAAGGAQDGTGNPGTVGTLAGCGPGGGWRLGADEAAAGQLVVSTLQGGGRRGHRIDAEGAAGGHLAVVPLALRGREHGSQAEAGENGDPAFALRTPAGGSSRGMVAYAITARNDRNDRNDREQTWITHALTSEGHDASEDGTGRGSPLVPVFATLTSGRAASPGVNPPGRRGEDDVNLVPMAFNPQTGGSKARLGYGEKPTALSCTQATGVQTATAVRRLTPKERERLQGFPDDWTRWRLEDGHEVEQSDAARDRQTGNAVAVPVVQWIAERLVAVDSASTVPAETTPGAAA